MSDRRLIQWCDNASFWWSLYNTLSMEMPALTHWSQGDAAIIFKMLFLVSSYRLITCINLVKLPSCECHNTHWQWVHTGSGNSLVSNATKPLPEQCWPRSVLPYGNTRPQWIKTPRPEKMVATLQMTFSYAFSPFVYFYLNSTDVCYQRVQLKIKKFNLQQVGLFTCRD